MDKILGIDLGTTNSCMAVLEGKDPVVIPNAEGDHTTPSVVAYPDGERIVGKSALNQQVLNASNTFYSVKRFIGRTYNELYDEDLADLAYHVGEGDRGRPVMIADDDVELLPEAVSAAVLQKLKNDASAFLGESVTKAVITVPAYFNDAQRQATRDAGKIAGLDVLRIINEPTAAALAYGFDGNDKSGEKTLLVFDFGGGTLDVSILEVSPGLVQVISTAGDNYLGGDDIDSLITNYLCDHFAEDEGIDLYQDDMTFARVREAARKAKEDLSSSKKTTVNLPFVAAGPQGPVHMKYEITREQFNELISDIISSCKSLIFEALEGSAENPIDLKVEDLDEILLVGGSTRIPAIQEMIEEVCGKRPNKTVNPDEVVALGAAIQGGVLEGGVDDIVLSDVCSMTLGIKVYPNKVAVMIPKNTPIPTSEKKVFSTAEDNQDNVEIVIIQGEAPEADDPYNKALGTAVLGNIPPMTAGTPKIEITMTYDVNGIVQVTAQELSSGASINVRIDGSSRLNDSEILALMKAEADSK